MALNSWTKYKLSDLIASNVVAIGDGYRAKNSELCPSKSGLPFARAGNINSGFQFDAADYLAIDNVPRAGEKVSQPGDVLFTSKGTVGRVACVSEKTPEFVYSPQLTWWRVKDAKKIEPRFLYYWMHGREFYVQINGLRGQTDMADYVSLRDQRQMMHVTLPPLDEQKAIAHILGTLDDKIELNQQMNRTLEAIARALFKSWFIDFDPVRAKLDGRQLAGKVSETQTGGTPSGSDTFWDAETAALFPDEFEDGGAIGQIPKGWRVKIIGDVVEVNSRSVTKDYPYQLIQYVDISSVTVGWLEGTTIYALADAPSRAKRLVRHGDTIWSGVRPNRKSYLFIHTPPENLVVSTGFIVLSPKAIPPSYLYAWVMTDEFVDYLVFNADGSAYPAVRPDRFSNAQILIPLKATLDRFEQQAGSMRDKIIQNERESTVLASIRDALLPKLLSGEIRIQDAETVVEGVT